MTLTRIAGYVHYLTDALFLGAFVPPVWVGFIGIPLGAYMHNRTGGRVTGRGPVLLLPLVPGVALEVGRWVQPSFFGVPDGLAFWSTTVGLVALTLWLAKGFRWLAVSACGLCVWMSSGLAVAVSMKVTGEGP